MGNRKRNETGGYQTGDINLAAALMACGVPPSPEDPVTIIQPEHGRRYGSFRLMESTMDGQDKTADLMEAWAAKRPLEQSHPFEQICRFLLSFRTTDPADRSTEAMLDYAIDYLRLIGFNPMGVRGMADIPKYVESKPKSVDAFILAFIHCRDLLFQMFHRAKTDFYFSRGSGADARHALISDNLPKWMRNELTSRLQG